MNTTDFDRDRPSLELLGKGFIIVMVVVFSALSFTLGYFVGKSGIEKKPAENLSQAAEMTPLRQKQEPEPLPGQHIVPVGENTPRAGETVNENIQPQQKEPSVLVEAKQPVPLKSLQHATEKTQGQPVSQQMPKESMQKPAAQDSVVVQDGKKADEPVYTLQIGAFKSAAEAESIRKKFAKKGFKPYITTSTSNKKEKIYKVKTGEFRDRKNAEILSLKLNKTEQLKTFVTLKNE